MSLRYFCVRKCYFLPCLCFLAGLLLCVNAASVLAEDHHSAACGQDGYASAPVGQAQHPDLLADYLGRPPCHVAGVDYRVGYPSDTPFQDPENASWKAPFSYDRIKHVVRCDLGSNAVIRGFDFSMHGGTGIYDASCANLTIENNNFQVGASCTMPVNQSLAASGITVRNNLVDGGGWIPACASDPVGEDILLGGSGSKIVEYNWLRNVAQHFLSLSGSGDSARIRYNLIERCGFYQGNHCNGIQFVGGTWVTPIVSYNTYVSDQPDANGGLHGSQVAGFAAGSNTVVTGSDYGLVTLEHTAAASLAAGMLITSPNLPSGTTISIASNSGGPCCAGPGTSPVITRLELSQKALRTGRVPFEVPNAYPSGLVNPIQIVAQVHAVIRNAHVEHNVAIASPGPVTTVSYAISIGSDDSSLNVDAVVMDNYVDDRGAYGAFYPGDCLHSPHCYGAAFSHNVDMTTGIEIRPPE